MPQVKKAQQKPDLVEQGTPPGLGQKKRETNDLCNQGLASQGEHRASVHIRRENTRKDKAHLDLMLSNAVSDNNKKRIFTVCQQQEEIKGKHWIDT